MIVTVYHRGYGCGTGCCGHVIDVDGERVGGFDFGHPNDSTPEECRRYAEEFVRQELGEDNVADLDWDNSTVSSD